MAKYIEQDLGNISFNPRGVYDPELTYYYLDLVEYMSCAYLCRTQCKGVLPQATSSSCWQLLSKVPDGCVIDDVANDYNTTMSSAMIRQQYELLSMNKIDGAYVQDGYLNLTANGEVVIANLGPFSGTGGGSGSGDGGPSNNATMTMVNRASFITTSIAEGMDIDIMFDWSSIESEMETGPGTMRIVVNGVAKVNMSVAQGSVTHNIGPYLRKGVNTVRVTVTDVYNNIKNINYSINSVSLTISSGFDSTLAYQGPIQFTYTPVGNMEKTVYFVLDGETIATEIVTSSGRQLSKQLPAQSHGNHTLLVYFEAVVNGITVRSNELFYDITCIGENESGVIITSPFRLTEAKQYTTLNIQYKVFNPLSMTSDIQLKVNNTVIASLTVPRDTQIWSYRLEDQGTIKMEIVCGTVNKVFNITVTDSGMNLQPETDALELYLNTKNRSNNEANPAVWTHGNISCTFSNFNWKTDGWVLDDDGNTVMRVSNNAVIDIPFKIFKNDFRTTGKTIELEFATRDVKNFNAEVLSCFAGGKGIVLTGQQLALYSEQSNIGTQYKDNEHIRVSFVVEKRSENRLIYAYINGIASACVQYPDTDDFAQTTPCNISIGNPECTTDIYNIRIYNNSLTRHQIINNWIADTQNVDELLEKYTHNDVYDEYGDIVIDKLPKDLPYMILEAPELPTFKGDKKTVSGSYVNPSYPARSFTFTGAQFDVQGTSSAGYERKNFKGKFKNGFVMDNGSTVDGYSIVVGGIPESTFCFKADVASSEGANNVELVRAYNDLCPYKTPPQTQDDRVRQGIDGFPIVIFHNDGTTTKFVGKYNFNNDKSNEDTIGFTDGCESWEICNNTSNRVLFKSADFEGTDWLNDFEGRYPEDNTDATNLRQMVAWVTSTDTEAATNEPLTSPISYGNNTYNTDSAEYRLDKFKYEFEDWFELDSMLFYYLFTEAFLMVDSRAKNAFPSKFTGGKWCMLPYDMDTAIGINNEGTLAFTYWLEDTDTVGGADVYNGQNSVLWINLRRCFPDELANMYKDLRANALFSYEGINGRFEEHQSKWPEVIFNEDAYYKYIQPLIEKGMSNYLSMLQGSKAAQRRWWLYNRFKYLDSKYIAGEALRDIVTIRGYAKDNIELMADIKMYLGVKYGSYVVQTRGEANQYHILECPLDNVNDTEIYIYNASRISRLKDLTGLKPGYLDISHASSLLELTIHDRSKTDTDNPNLTHLSFGNNRLLEKVICTGCPNLTSSIDMSGCTSLKEVDFTGCSITGFISPSSDTLEKLSIPSTVTSLTVKHLHSLTQAVSVDYTKMSSLWLEDVSADYFNIPDIIMAVPENSRVRLLDWSLSVNTPADLTDLLAKIDTLRGIDENGNTTDNAQLKCTITIQNAKSSEIHPIMAKYPDIKFNIINAVWTVWYLDPTIPNPEADPIYVEEVVNGQNAPSKTYSKTADAYATYNFQGWSSDPSGTSVTSGVLNYITADKKVYAVLNPVVRYYTIWFRNLDGTLLATQTYTYGATVTPPDIIPEDPTGANRLFFGWTPAITSCTNSTTYTASFQSDIYIPGSTITFQNGSTCYIEGFDDYAATIVEYIRFVDTVNDIPTYVIHDNNTRLSLEALASRHAQPLYKFLERFVKYSNNSSVLYVHKDKIHNTNTPGVIPHKAYDFDTCWTKYSNRYSITTDTELLSNNYIDMLYHVDYYTYTPSTDARNSSSTTRVVVLTTYVVLPEGKYYCDIFNSERVKIYEDPSRVKYPVSKISSPQIGYAGGILTQCTDLSEFNITNVPYFREESFDTNTEQSYVTDPLLTPSVALVAQQSYYDDPANIKFPSSLVLNKLIYGSTYYAGINNTLGIQCWRFDNGARVNSLSHATSGRTAYINKIICSTPTPLITTRRNGEPISIGYLEYTVPIYDTTILTYYTLTSNGVFIYKLPEIPENMDVTLIHDTCHISAACNVCIVEDIKNMTFLRSIGDTAYSCFTFDDSILTYDTSYNSFRDFYYSNAANVRRYTCTSITRLRSSDINTLYVDHSNGELMPKIYTLLTDTTYTKRADRKRKLLNFVDKGNIPTIIGIPTDYMHRIVFMDPTDTRDDLEDYLISRYGDCLLIAAGGSLNNNDIAVYSDILSGSTYILHADPTQMIFNWIPYFYKHFGMASRNARLGFTKDGTPEDKRGNRIYPKVIADGVFMKRYAYSMLVTGLISKLPSLCTETGVFYNSLVNGNRIYGGMPSLYEASYRAYRSTTNYMPNLNTLSSITECNFMYYVPHIGRNLTNFSPQSYTTTYTNITEVVWPIIYSYDYIANYNSNSYHFSLDLDTYNSIVDLAYVTCEVYYTNTVLNGTRYTSLVINGHLIPYNSSITSVSDVCETVHIIGRKDNTGTAFASLINRLTNCTHVYLHWYDPMTSTLDADRISYLISFVESLSDSVVVYVPDVTYSLVDSTNDIITSNRLKPISTATKYTVRLGYSDKISNTFANIDKLYIPQFKDPLKLIESDLVDNLLPSNKIWYFEDEDAYVVHDLGKTVSQGGSAAQVILVTRTFKEYNNPTNKITIGYIKTNTELWQIPDDKLYISTNSYNMLINVVGSENIIGLDNAYVEGLI